MTRFWFIRLTRETPQRCTRDDNGAIRTNTSQLNRQTGNQVHAQCMCVKLQPNSIEVIGALVPLLLRQADVVCSLNFELRPVRRSVQWRWKMQLNTMNFGAITDQQTTHKEAVPHHTPPCCCITDSASTWCFCDRFPSLHIYGALCGATASASTTAYPNSCCSLALGRPVARYLQLNESTVGSSARSALPSVPNLLHPRATCSVPHALPA
jgi:hypothetical protein